MGQAGSTGADGFRRARVREQYAELPALWSEDDLAALLGRLRALPLSLSLDEAGFGRLLQLPGSPEADLGYSDTKREALRRAGKSEVAGLSHEEKLMQCAHEWAASLPDRPPDPEEEKEYGDKMQAVKEALDERFGEIITTQVWNAMMMRAHESKGEAEFNVHADDLPESAPLFAEGQNLADVSEFSQKGTKELEEMVRKIALCVVKDAKLQAAEARLQVSAAAWFGDFSRDRPSGLADGLEFVAAAVLVSARASAARKLALLFDLFDAGRRGRLRRSDFVVALKAVALGLGRVVSGLPPPASLAELGGLAEALGVPPEGLSPDDWARWALEADLPLRYLAAFSRLGSGAGSPGNSAVLGWGANRRGQLGLQFAPGVQPAPVPLLSLEGVRVHAVASHESHTIFLTEEGHLWTCGAGFSGLLGHGGLEDCARPRLLESLAHLRAVAVAAGARHSAAVTSDGRVHTWGAADLGQLGHGLAEAGGDGDCGGAGHVLCSDPTSGGTFSYVPAPTQVRGALEEDGAAVVGVACCSYSTLALTDDGRVYSWGNNTDGQCGLGQNVPGERTVYFDRHMARTALKVVATPRRVEASAAFRALACGGYHALALDRAGSVWSWGQGMWGKLGHGDSRTMYEPKLVEALEHRGVSLVAAGKSHSVCLGSLYRLTVSSGSKEMPLSPFNLLGLPVGRVARGAEGSEMTTPPGTSLQLRACASAPLMSVGLPFRFEPGSSQVNTGSHPAEAVRESVVLVDRGLAQGVWLKLATTDFDFSVKMAASGAQVPTRQGLTGDVMTAREGMYVADTDCKGKLCVIELPEPPSKNAAAADPEESVVLRVLDVARGCHNAGAVACVCALPPGCDAFRVQVNAVLQAGVAAMGVVAAGRASVSAGRPSAVHAVPSGGSLGSGGAEVAAGGAQPMPLGFLDQEHGQLLRRHLARLVAARAAEAAGGVPEEARAWRRGQEEFSGKPFWEHRDTGEKRWTPPLVGPGALASLVVVREEFLVERLLAVARLQPKAIVLCQQSWRPDAELVALTEAERDQLQVPVACVTYEAAEELRRLERGRPGAARLWVTVEAHATGAVFAWGDGTMGQLGLGGIANGSLLTHTANALTSEEHSFASLPRYVSSLHEEQVAGLACGAQHTLAVNKDGEVFSWGRSEGLGAAVSDEESSEVPVLVDQLEGHFRVSRAFAGHDHSFAVAESSVQSVI